MAGYMMGENIVGIQGVFRCIQGVFPAGAEAILLWGSYYEINHFETRGCVSPLFQQKAFKTSYDQLTEKFQELENEGYDTC